MSNWLQKRLAIWMGVSLLGGALVWNGGALQAQNEKTKTMLAKTARGDSKLSRDEAAQGFVLAMNQPNIAMGLLDACVSPSNRAQLRFGMGRMLREMSGQWKRPTRIIKLQSQTSSRAVVLLGGAGTRASRPLILTRENGGWGVDLIETYARWNNLRGAAKAKAIYEISGAVLPALPQSEDFKRTLCQSNLKRISLALLQYAADHDGPPPAKSDWIKVIQPYIDGEKPFNCPALPGGQRFGYALNAKMTAASALDSSLASQTVSVYETTILKRSASGAGEHPAFRHQNGANYAFADGHVKWFAKGQTPSFKLKP